MNESDRRQRVISSTPQLSPEEVATRAFGSKVRGYAESEVRAFLRRVSDQLMTARDRERELVATVDALEERVRAPRPLDEQELLDALGEETARLLRSAREAGNEIRRKADERAARLTEDASLAAERVRNEAEALLVSSTHEAETRVAEMLATAEAHAAALRDAAITDGEAIIEAARRQGREMLDEAKGARERVLGDLVRRRSLLQAQVEALRTGRDRLLDAYRAVKRTFLDATEALAQVEARAAAERSSAVSEPLDIAAEIAAEIAALDAVLEPADIADGGARVETSEVSLVEADAAVAAAVADGEGGEDLDDSGGLADVDSLFARIRAGHADAPEPVGAAEEAPGEGVPGEGVPGEGAPAVPAADPVNAVSADEWRNRRTKATDPLSASLFKRSKRALQDDQNTLLDAVRRHKGRPRAEQVLPDIEVLLRSWMAVLRDPGGRAYGAGWAAVGEGVPTVPDDVLRDAAEMIVMPLRERVTVAVDSGDEGDTGGLVERIGARYREWKNQQLESTVADVLAYAWSRGVYDAAPADALLAWVPAGDGCCADCDDNGLEATVKGKMFPTGQPFPPAHPGCRCVLAPTEALAPATMS